MHNAGPDGEPNQAQMGQWIARGDHQKYSERCVNSDNHQEIVGMTGVPPPAGWPENRQWIDSRDENEADGHQGNPQVLEAKSIDHALALCREGSATLAHPCANRPCPRVAGGRYPSRRRHRRAHRPRNSDHIAVSLPQAPGSQSRGVSPAVCVAYEGRSIEQSTHW